MARPGPRLDDVEAAGTVRTERDEFWVANPWRYPADKNLSAFEPNRVYLNRGSAGWLDVTPLSGADSVGDGRGVLVADVDGDLQPDLIVRQIGGGSLRIYRNEFPRANRLTVSLEGTRSNRLGIGARVEAHVAGRRLVRELFPTNNHTVQQASRVRFGLAQSKTIDRLVVHWPSGTTQTLENVPANQHLEIREPE